MRKVVLLVVIVLSFACRIHAQKSAPAHGFNFYSFTDDKVNITPELDALTSKEYKSHPEYGVLPFNAPCKDCIELLQKRDEGHRYFVKEGSKGKEFYQQSSYGNLSYSDASGALRTLDPRMRPTGKPGVFEAKNQPLPVTINIPEKFTAILNAGKELQVNRDVNIYVKHKDGSVTSLGAPNWSNYTAGDDGVIVHDFYPGIDLEMQLGTGRVESFYRLNKPLQLGDGWLVIRDNMKVPQGLVYDYSYSAQKENNSYEGTVFLNDERGTPYFYIGAPAAYDENNEHDNAINLDYQIADNGVYDLYIPTDWMNDADRSYPLVIDPFVTATSVLPEATITGSRYNATCFANGCQYPLAVAVPPACIVTAMTYSFNYTATGTCNLNQGAWDLTWGGCRSPSNGATWHTCTIGLPGLCILDSLSCFSDFQSCLTPQCAGYNIPMVLTFYRCVQNIPGCGFSCIMAATPWTMTVTGHTIAVTSTNSSICKGSSVNITATADSGIAPYTYTWTPGNLVGQTVSVSPATTTVYTVTAIDCGGGSQSTQVTATDTVTVYQNDNPGFIIVPNPACQNSSVTVTGNGNAAATSYSWSSPGGNPASTNNQQSFNVTYPNSGNDNITLHWTSPTTGCHFDSTLQITINPNLVPSVSITANPNPICPGVNVTFNATVTNGGANPTYQWYINGNQVGGATSNPFSSSTLNNGDVVTVHIISNAPCVQPDSAVSNAVTMVVNPNVVPSAVIVAVPSGPICAGTNVVFTVTPTNGGTNPSYQWYLNGNQVGTGTTYSSSTLVAGDQIVVHLLNSNVNCVLPDSAVSNIITIVLSAVIPPSVNIVVAPSDTICPGTNVTLTATPNNEGANPQYQWYVNGNPVGTSIPTYSSSTLNNGDVITVHLRNAIAPCVSPDTAVSNAITIVYSPPIAPVVSITVSPSDTICPGTSVTFTATPSSGLGSPTYQWYLNGNSVAGENSSTYSSSGLNNGNVISVHLLNATGPCISPDTAVSNAITIVYSPPIAPIVSITVSPSDTICPGTPVTFTATPSSGIGSPSYEWYLNGNQVGTGGTTFSSSTLVAGDAIEVHLLNATGPCVSPDSAVSNIIIITISPLIAPTISIIGADTICPGQNVTFTSTITNWGSNPGYQWYLNGNQVAGENGSSYSSTTFNNGDVISVHLLNAIGPCISPDSAVSNSLTIVYNPPVVPAVSIVAVPAGIICQGQTVTFTATGTGGGHAPSYQWFINSVPTGPNDTVFSYSSFKNGDVVSVTLTSNDPCANPTTANSNHITIQMYPPMSVVATGDTTICPGESVPINSVAGGGEGAPYTYTWDNGAGNDSAETVSPGQTTTYAVLATDACGSTPATDSATVIVSPVPVPNFTFSPDEPTEYSRTVYFTDRSQGAVTWNWNFGDSKSSDSTSTSQDPNHTFSGVGTFTVKLIVTNAAGCIDSITYTVDVTEEYAYYIPNAFTPNGDGINDYFAPQGTHDLIYEMTIYNRWGEKIFETMDTSLPWSGTVTGSNKIAEAGVYVYRIRFVDSRYTSDVLVGSVTLVR